MQNKFDTHKGLRLCPRCHSTYSYIRTSKRRSNIYLYAVHYHNSDGGRRQERVCYLGAMGSYKHVESLLNLNLRGLKNIDLLSIAYRALETLTLRNADIPPEKLEQLHKQIHKLRKQKPNKNRAEQICYAKNADKK